MPRRDSSYWTNKRVFSLSRLDSFLDLIEYLSCWACCENVTRPDFGRCAALEMDCRNTGAIFAKCFRGGFRA